MKCGVAARHFKRPVETCGANSLLQSITSYLHQRRYVLSFRFVCLSVPLRKNYQDDFHESMGYRITHWIRMRFQGGNHFLWNCEIGDISFSGGLSSLGVLLPGVQFFGSEEVENRSEKGWVPVYEYL